MPSRAQERGLSRLDLCRSRHLAPRPACRLQTLRRLHRQQAGAYLFMNRREFSFGAMAMAMQATAPKYRIIDAQVHVWINDAHYPWAPETKKPPTEDRTPAMLLDQIGRASCRERV